MELPGRLELEAHYQRKLGKLSVRHRKELLQLLGSPPDPLNVPDSFWEKVRREVENENAAILLLLFLASANSHARRAGRDPKSDAALSGLLQTQASAYAGDAGRRLGAQYTNSSRDSLNRNRDDWQKPGITKAEIATDVGTIFGPARTEGIVISETTDAQTAGGESGVLHTTGFSDEDLWRTEDDLSVCPICRPLHNKKRSEWQSLFPRGPKAHPRCRCWISYAYERKAA